ncbi:MAG: hypothetical protein GC153_04115 [Alphaproteobacteria bacterium]|nr:hypothetical protein [Alphaproteobacteria bacterium]
MTRRLLIECGSAETRAALIVGEDVTRFWFLPARGDETLHRQVAAGEIVVGRVRTVAKPLDGAFVDIGDVREAFLPLRGGKAVEGEKAIFLVRRPALGSKGAVLSRNWKQRLAPEIGRALEAEAARKDDPGRLGPAMDPALQAFGCASSRTSSDIEIVVDARDAAGLFGGAGAVITFEDAPFEKFGADEALEAALDRAAPLPGGGRLLFDEAEGATVVDVDSGAAAGGGREGLNDQTNAAAAARLFKELSRRAIGGRVIVDFLPPSNAGARRRLLQALDQARKDVFDCRFGKLAADGLFDLTAPRERLSLLEHSTESAGARWVRPGRRLTLDWRAKAAVRALEARLRARPSASFVLFAEPEIAAYLEDRPQWMTRISARYGARFAMRRDQNMREPGFDVAEQNERTARDLPDLS